MARGRRAPRAARAAVAAAVAVISYAVIAGGVAPPASAANTPLWGIDTIDNTQTSNDITATQSVLGNPQFVGRYFIWGGGATIGSAEIAYLHSLSLPILMLDSAGNSTLVGAATGTSEAQDAIRQAASLGVPTGRALFRDVERGYNIDSAYVTAFVNAFQGSGYVPGFYENPLGGQFDTAYCGAVSGSAAISTQSVLFSSEPEQQGGDPSRAAMPAWSAAEPPCANTTVAWQYEERGLFPAGSTAPNVDVDEYLPQYIGLLWGPGGSYQAVTPQRILDTRADGPRIGICSNGCVTLGPDTSLDLQVEGAGGIPGSGVTAVVLNVTVTNPTAGSDAAPNFVTVYPTGQSSRPLASNLNFVAGETVPNLVEVAIGSGGRVTIYNHDGTTDVLADVEGYALGNPTTPLAGLFNALPPRRIGDTRAGSGLPDQGESVGTAGLHPVQVLGQGGVPSTGVAAVVLNVTVTNPTAGTPSAPNFATVLPGGAAVPLASNLNFVAGETVPNRVIVPVGGDGQIWIYNRWGTSDFIVDVNGWLTDGSSTTATGSTLHGLVPARICDTRSGTGTECTGSPLAGNRPMNVMVAGRGGIPAMGGAGAPTAVIANVTVTNATAGTPQGPAYLTVYPGPAGSTVPVISDLNFTAGETVPNLVVVKLGPDGSINLELQQGTADVIVDVVGWY